MGRDKAKHSHTERLVSLIEKKLYLISRWYMQNKRVRYMELFNIKDGHQFLLDLGTQYKFKKSSKLDKTHRFMLKEISKTDLKKERTLDDELIYDKVDAPAKNEAERVLHGYKNRITLEGEDEEENIGDTHNARLLELVEQVRRLSTIMKQVPYKLAIYNYQHVCILNRDEKTKLYHLPQYPVKRKQVFIVVSLEDFYATPNIGASVRHVKTSLYNILELNQTGYKKKVVDSGKHLESIGASIAELNSRKKVIRAHISEAESLFVRLNEIEEEIYMSGENKSMKPKIMRQKLDTIQEKRTSLLSKINSLTTEYNSIVFTLDDIYYSSLISLSSLMNSGIMLRKMLSQR